MRNDVIIDHLGNEYSSITEMCDAYDISRCTYLKRLKRGWTQEAALTSAAGNNAGAERKYVKEEYKARISARDKAYREVHKEKYAALGKAYREAHKEEIAASKKAYCEAHKEEIAARGKAYYEAHKEEIAASKKLIRKNI